jgi:tape measure domain-containing protein
MADVFSIRGLIELAGAAAANQELDELSGHAAGAGQSLESAGKKSEALAGVLDMLGGAVVKVGTFITASVTAPLAGLITGAAHATVNWIKLVEGFNVTAEAMLGSKEAANDLYQDIYSIGKASIYSREALLPAAKQLVGLGVSADETTRWIQAATDAVSAFGGSGEDIQQITNAFATAHTQGKMTMLTVRQMANSGVNALQILGNQYGVTREEMQEMISKGAVPADEAINLLTKGMEEGTDGVNGLTKALEGMSAKMQGKTLSGAFATLRNAVRTFNTDLMGMDPTMRSTDERYAESQQRIGQLTVVILKLAEIVKLLPKIFAPVTDAVGKVLDKLVGSNVVWNEATGEWENAGGILQRIIDYLTELDPEAAAELGRKILILAGTGPALLILGKAIQGVANGIKTYNKLAGYVRKLTTAKVEKATAETADATATDASNAANSKSPNLLTKAANATKAAIAKFTKASAETADAAATDVSTAANGKAPNLISKIAGIAGAAGAKLAKAGAETADAVATGTNNIVNSKIPNLIAKAAGIAAVAGAKLAKAAAETVDTVATGANTIASGIHTVAIRLNNSALAAGVRSLIAYSAAHKVAMLTMLGVIGLFVGMHFALKQFDGDAEAMAAAIEAWADKITAKIEAFSAALPGIIESIMPKITTAVTAIVTAVATALPVLIQAALGAIIMLIASLVQLLPPIIQAVSSAFITIAQSLVTLLPPIIDALIKTIAQLLPALVDTFVQLFLSIVSMVATLAPVLIDAFLQVFMSLVQVLDQILPPLIDAFVQLITALAEMIVVVIPTLIEAFITILMAVVNALPIIIPALINACVQIFSALVAALPQIIAALIAAIPQIVTAIYNGFVEAWPAIKQAFIDLWESIKATALILWEEIKEKLLGVVVVIQAALAEKWEAIKAKVVEVWDKVKTAIMTPIEAAKEKVAAVVDAVKSKITSVFDSIKEKATTVWNGIKAAITSPIETARDVVKGIIDAIKGFFNFSISWPKIPLPHFGVTPKGWSVGDLLKGKLPKLAIDWYAEGGILEQPTIFAAQGNRLMGGGEAGAEAITPIDTLRGYVREEVTAAMSGSNERLATLMAELVELTREYLPQAGSGDVLIDGDVLVGSIAPRVDRSLSDRGRAATRGFATA